MTRMVWMALVAPLIVGGLTRADDGEVAAGALPAGTASTRPAFTPIHLGFEEADHPHFELNKVVIPAGNRYHFYTENGMRFDLPASGKALDPVLSTEQAASGKQSLKLVCVANDGTDRDRIELRVKHSQGDEAFGRDFLTFGQDRWYGAKIYIDPSTTPPTRENWIHLHQLWQPAMPLSKASGYGLGVPLAMSLHAVAVGQPAKFDLYGVAKSDAGREQMEIGDLTPGQWHELTFNVKLSHGKDDIDGYWRVWVDGKRVIDQTVDIGNYPRHNEPPGFDVGSTMDLRFGIYRKAQQTTTTIYLDDVWFDNHPHDPNTRPRAEAKPPTK
jgi:hypothetical protein